MQRFTKGLDALIEAGYIVRMDRARLIADQRQKATQVLGQETSHSLTPPS